MPTLIETLETELDSLHTQLADPVFYREQDKVVAAKKRLTKLETQHTEAFARWEELEAIASTQ